MKYLVRFPIHIHDAEDPLSAAKAALLILRETEGHTAHVAPMPEGHPIHGDEVQVVLHNPVTAEPPRAS